MKILHNNKKANFEYEIQNKFEAGIALEGWEVKSVKNHSVSIDNAYVKIENGEAILKNSSIPSWSFGEQKTKEQEERDRKLLLKKKEIAKIEAMLNQERYTAVPTKIYLNNRGLVKIEIGLGRGRRKYDKRQKLKEKDLKRRINQDLL
ncbi:MAG: SsrA-binding protein SmpB [Candidatus Dojkabacteria bacterium]